MTGVPPVYGVTLAKRRLSRRLAELRLARGYTGNQVCDMLSWGRGKVGRIEANTWKRPEMSDLRDLLHLYQADGDEQRELAELAELARTRSWWREYGDVFGDTEFPGLEADAAGIRLYTPVILPGLLQTPAYSQAQLRAGQLPAQRLQRAVAARQRRQRLLDRPAGLAPELVAVITEAPLHYRWGTTDERRAQVSHLLELSRRPNVELHLLRFEDGLHPGVCGPITIFDFPGSEPPAVFLETDFAMQEVSDPADVAAYTDTFGRILAAALDAPATTAHLKQLAKPQ